MGYGYRTEEKKKTPKKTIGPGVDSAIVAHDREETLFDFDE